MLSPLCLSTESEWFGMLLFLTMIPFLRTFPFLSRQRSAFVVGIGFITAISWFRNTAITYFPNTDEGDARFEYFKQVVRIEELDKLLANFSSDFSGVGVALFTFLYVDFLDTSVRTFCTMCANRIH